MRRIAASLKCRILPSRCKREQRQQAQLIRRRDHDPSARLRDADELPYERARVFEVFDHFDRSGHLGGRIRQRQLIAIEIRALELDLLR